jgi:hypothetical protein
MPVCPKLLIGITKRLEEPGGTAIRRYASFCPVTEIDLLQLVWGHDFWARKNYSSAGTLSGVKQRFCRPKT